MKPLNEGSLRNLASLYENVARNVDDVNIETRESLKIVTTVGSSWPNSVYDIFSVLQKDDLEEIDSCISQNSELRIAIIDPLPENFALYKEKKIFPAGKWKGMIFDKCSTLRNLEENDGFSIFVSDNEISLWGSVVSRVLFNDAQMSENVLKGLLNPNNQIVALKHGDQIIGTTLIHYDTAGTAGLYFVCILPEYQGKGLGKKIVQYSLKKISEVGREVCYLQATPAGLPVYKSIGFAETQDYYLYYKLKK